MRYLVVLIVIILVVFSACNLTEPYYIQLADQITLKVAKQLQKEDGLILIGTGGQMMDDIQQLNMGFDFYHEVELSEARELLVHAVEKYLFAINNNEKIRPYLHEYPFTAKNIEIRIWVMNPDKTEVSLDKIFYCNVLDGIFRYYLHLPETHSRKLILEETYEEAIEKLNEAKFNPNKQTIK